MNVIYVGAIPQARSYWVGGRLVNLVNWMNYQGWEVRFADGDRPLGLIHEHTLENISKWVAEPAGNSAVTWDTLDEALAYLVGRSN